MNKILILTAVLAGVGSAARAATLTEHLPSGALLTFETRDAGGAVDRLSGVATRFARALGDESGVGEMVSGFGAVLKGSVGQEAALGVFTVGTGRGKFTPGLLAVSRVDELSAEFFGSMVARRPGARVGNYTFVRQGNTFVGMSGGLVYVSTHKDLLMAYLARLSGKGAPRLLNSAAYTVPTRARGTQELSLFLNFSAAAKVARSALSEIMLPRLLSPVVDAVDTLGQYSAGFTTTPQGLNSQAAHLPNPQGKDRPLYAVLTHSTDFGVQDIIPADVEAVAARACHPDSNPYLGRWLTRVDLIDPLGFLTDSQLASHLERSARYLGGECAQVTLTGGLKAGLNQSDPLAALAYSVSYQRVRDLDAARAHLPEYTGAVNAAIAGAGQTLGDLLSSGPELPEELMGAGAAGLNSLTVLTDALAELKMVYAFRGDYLITAFSDEALAAALAGGETLAQDAGFRAANLPLTASAGWQYARDPEALSGEEILSALPEELGQMGPLFGVFSGLLADTVNRYGGMTSQSRVLNAGPGKLVLDKASVRYDW